MSTSKESEGRGTKRFGELLRVIIFRGACDLECMFVVFFFLCRAEVGGCAALSGDTSPPQFFPKCIKLNDWQWLKPHRAWGKLPGLRLGSAHLLSLSLLQVFFMFFFFFSFWQRIFVCHTNVVHRYRSDKKGQSLLHPVRQHSTQCYLRGWANTVASSNTPQNSSRESQGQ